MNKHQAPHAIVKTEIDSGSVRLTLNNGVVVHISSNDGYIHLNFSGAQIPMLVGGDLTNQALCVKTSNLANIGYKPSIYNGERE